MAMKVRTHNTETATYAQMGMASLLPGMVHLAEMMAQEVEKFRAQLAAMQEPARRVGRPSGARGRSGWPADPEERKAEMARRQKVAAKRQAKVTDGRARAWAALSPAQKKKRVAKMLAGRKKTQTATLEKVA